MQVAILKDTISKKDNEIERLHLLKEIQVEKHGTRSLRYESSRLSTQNLLELGRTPYSSAKLKTDKRDRLRTQGSF